MLPKDMVVKAIVVARSSNQSRRSHLRAVWGITASKSATA